jgi:hypothetical protein
MTIPIGLQNTATNWDGTQTAATLVGLGWIAYTSASTQNGYRYRTSWYVKAGANTTTVSFGWGGAHNGNRTDLVFNLQTGTFTSSTIAAGEERNSESLGNGWYRVWYTSTLWNGNAYFPQMNNGNGVVLLGGVKIEPMSSPYWRSDGSYQIRPGSSRNIYLTSLFPSSPTHWNLFRAKVWTFSALVRRADGNPITSLGVNLYTHLNGTSYTTWDGQGTVTPDANNIGWYRVRLEKVIPGESGEVPTRVGFFGFESGVTYYLTQAELLPFNKGYVSGANGRRPSDFPTTSISSPISDSIIWDTNPWGVSELVWDMKNHEVSAITWNGGFNGPMTRIDPTKTYRYSIWLNRKVAGSNGHFYFGTNGLNSLGQNVGVLNSRNFAYSRSELVGDSWNTIDAFGASPWTSFTVTSGQSAPDGTNTAVRLQRTASTNNDGICYGKHFTFTQNRRYKYSVYLKLGPSFPTNTLQLGTLYGPRVYGSAAGISTQYQTVVINKNTWVKWEAEFVSSNTGIATVRAFEHGTVFQGAPSATNNAVDVYVWGASVEDITADTNPYFTAFTGNQSQISNRIGQWVLVVGHIHPAGSSFGSLHPNSGLYHRSGNGLTYAPISGDFIWRADNTQSNLRSYLFYCSDRTVQQQFLRPRIDVVDGNEPSIEDLLNNRENTVSERSRFENSVYSLNSTPWVDEVGGAFNFANNDDKLRTVAPINLGNSGNATWEAVVWDDISRRSIDGLGSMFMGMGVLPYFRIISNYYSGNRGLIHVSSSISGTQRNLYSGALPALKPYTWHHYAFTFEYDGVYTNVKIYLDGLLVARTTTPDDPIAGNRPWLGKHSVTSGVFTLGGRLSSGSNPADRVVGASWGDGLSYHYAGKVAYARAYSRTLNEQEVAQNYNVWRARQLRSTNV